MEKSLFKKSDETYTEDANSLCNEAGLVIRTLISEYIAKGYKIREIQYILDSVVSCESLTYLLTENAKKFAETQSKKHKGRNSA